jgi:predicted RNase H-like nuclease
LLMSGERVLGVDACRAGWVGITLKGVQTRGYLANNISDLAKRVATDGPLDVVAIDIPIGLPDQGRRQADILARAAIGARRSSVFMTPVRSALLASTHAAAVAINRELAGEGISMQAYGLRTKLLEVERWVTDTDYRVVEVHPEVSFALLAGAPLTTRKATWAGAQHRIDLLATAGISMAGDLGAAGAAGVDDVLDAAVGAWTARRYVQGQAICMPDPPEVFSDGLPCAIWA